MRAWERINLTRRLDKQMRTRKESNIFIIENHKTSNMNKKESNVYRIFKTTRRKTKKLQE